MTKKFTIFLNNSSTRIDRNNRNFYLKIKLNFIIIIIKYKDGYH